MCRWFNRLNWFKTDKEDHNSKPLPNFLIRGSNEMGEDNQPVAHMLQFDNPAPDRNDGNHEESINWSDGEGAFDVLFNQRNKKNPENFQFRYGIVLSKKEIEKIKRSSNVRQMLSYERKILSDNKYHGNLLMHNSVPKPTRRKICATIALLAFVNVRNNPNIP